MTPYYMERTMRSVRLIDSFDDSRFALIIFPPHVRWGYTATRGELWSLLPGWSFDALDELFVFDAEG